MAKIIRKGAFQSPWVGWVTKVGPIIFMLKERKEWIHFMLQVSRAFSFIKIKSNAFIYKN